jgi:O-acetyl-ADP-ribose deacetylase (regulator of RNase III)
MEPGVKVVQGDIFKSECKTITNAVNCVGIMGGGIAKAFADKFPVMLADYHHRCHTEQLRMGRPYVFRDFVVDEDRHVHEVKVLNVPTMVRPGSKGNLPKIEAGLAWVAEHADEWELNSIAFPALGCGVGKLPFGQVMTAIKLYFDDSGLPVEIYEPWEQKKPSPGLRPRPKILVPGDEGYQGNSDAS